MMKEGLTCIAFTMATASRNVPSASGFADLSNPIWLSLICRNVKPVGSAASASPTNPTEWGTPPLTVQSTPVPAQTMHSSTSRRPNPFPRSSKPFLAMSHLPVGQTAPNGAANQETRPFRALFQNNMQFLDVQISLLKSTDCDGRASQCSLLKRIPPHNAPRCRPRRIERDRQPAPGLTMTLPFMFGWIEHR